MPKITALIICGALLLTASAASAQRVVTAETYCWDFDHDGDHSFDCTLDGRALGTLYDYPAPDVSQLDENTWPKTIQNYKSQTLFLADDLTECRDYVRTKTKYVGADDDHIFLNCVANVDWIAPLGIAQGNKNYSFGDPIESGREKPEKDGGAVGIIADVSSIHCGCYVIDDSFGPAD